MLGTDQGVERAIQYQRRCRGKKLPQDAGELPLIDSGYLHRRCRIEACSQARHPFVERLNHSRLHWWAAWTEEVVSLVVEAELALLVHFFVDRQDELDADLRP